MEIEQKETDCKCDNSTGWTRYQLQKNLALSNPRDRRNAQVELEKRFIILRTPPTNQTEKR